MSNKQTLLSSGTFEHFLEDGKNLKQKNILKQRPKK